MLLLLHYCWLTIVVVLDGLPQPPDSDGASGCAAQGRTSSAPVAGGNYAGWPPEAAVYINGPISRCDCSW